MGSALEYVIRFWFLRGVEARREELKANKCTLSVLIVDRSGQERTPSNTTQADKKCRDLVCVRFPMRCFQSDSLDLSLVNEFSGC